MKAKIEKRKMILPGEVRAIEDDEGKKLIKGRIPYNVDSRDMGFIETIKPGAFTKTLQEGDVRALWAHDVKCVLGRQSREVSFVEETDGLHFEIPLPENRTFALDCYDVVKTGDADGVSFWFRAIKDVWIEEEGEAVRRELVEVELIEVSVGVAFPAYEAAKAQTRAFEEVAGFDLSRFAGLTLRATEGTRSLSPDDLQFLRSSIGVVENLIKSSDDTEPPEHSEEEPIPVTLRRYKLESLIESFRLEAEQ